MKDTKPQKKDYGWHTQSGFDNEPSGWQIEGGEEAYAEALEKWLLVQRKSNQYHFLMAKRCQRRYLWR